MTSIFSSNAETLPHGKGERERAPAHSQPMDTKATTPAKLDMIPGVFVPVFLNIISILMFLRFGVILGQIGFIGTIGLLVAAYCINFLTTFSLSAIASNGEVKGGGAYYLISRSLGPEFGGSIGILFFLAQVLNTALNVVGLINCIKLYVGPDFPQGYWKTYGLETAALVLCTGLCLLGSATFSKASGGLLAVLSIAVISIPVSAIIQKPFHEKELNVHFTGIRLDTLMDNFLPHQNAPAYHGIATFRELFGILFPATSGIFAGASMSGDLREPSKAIPKGTLWAALTTFIVYFIVILSMSASIAHKSLASNPNIIALVNLSQPVILAGECAVTFFSSLMGLIGSAKLFQALAKDRLLPGLSAFGKGKGRNDEPLRAIFLTYALAQLALFADLNSIATFIAMGYQMTFFVMNLACFLLKIGSAPNFRPSFKFFSWQTACLGSLLSAAAMVFIAAGYAGIATCIVVFLFLLIHFLCPPKHWGDVSQNLIYHQVRKYLLRLKPEHIKFWRPQIILLVNNPRKQTRLIQFCNSLKKGSLYILGHVIVADDFGVGVSEAKLQQQAWQNYVTESSTIKAFVQLNMAPSIIWGVRNLILSSGLGGMRPNIAVLGFYNMEELRMSNPNFSVPDIPAPPAVRMRRPSRPSGKTPQRRRGDTSARLLERALPTDVIRTEGMMTPSEYMTMLEDLALRYRLNVAVAYGFENLETPRKDGTNVKQYLDLWPIQMSAEITSDGKSMLTTNFDTYTLILQLGHILRSIKTWQRAYKLRVLVFVEYESEVDEESARVAALLDKLRIDAEVKVFWLASGDLNTYELIVNGSTSDIDWEIVVNDALRDEEWWDDLQMLRGRWANISPRQERQHIAHIIESTVGRPGVYNPHEEAQFDRRRSSMAEVPDIPKRPAINVLSRLGVSAGMHTHHLHEDVLQDSGSSDESDSEDEFSDAGEFQRESEGHPTPGSTTAEDPTRLPLLSRAAQRRISTTGTASSGHSMGTVRGQEATSSAAATKLYGTISNSQGTKTAGQASRPPPKEHPYMQPENTNEESHGRDRSKSRQARKEQIEEFPPFDSMKPPKLVPVGVNQSGTTSPTRKSGLHTPRDGAATPIRPGVSRQSSTVRFSSRPVPETTITTEGEGPKISFATTDTPTPGPSRAERPTASRQSSYGKFSSRPVPETKVKVGDEDLRTITFAEEQPAPPSRGHSRHHSRQGSQYSQFSQGDVSVDVSEVAKSYRSGTSADEEPESGSPYSTQGISLSFNDLPSRAQHLILNELMRQNSRDTAVIISTLPIPVEGTSLDESASVQYLSDVEVLCNELPPTLMVLSNNMTVTVGL